MLCNVNWTLTIGYRPDVHNLASSCLLRCNWHLY
uniref:Uncharacterized protein n=1 Tax=Anguilla anguilla TaxID=7936 RepID=A0A0E9V3W7_ANGAN